MSRFIRSFLNTYVIKYIIPVCDSFCFIRSRDSGNSVRSRSSGSSTEVNHMSSTRDSGVHSSGEEQSKSPMSPNTTRRYCPLDLLIGIKDGHMLLLNFKACLSILCMITVRQIKVPAYTTNWKSTVHTH